MGNDVAVEQILADAQSVLTDESKERLATVINVLDQLVMPPAMELSPVEHDRMTAVLIATMVENDAALREQAKRPKQRI